MKQHQQKDEPMFEATISEDGKEISLNIMKTNTKIRRGMGGKPTKVGNVFINWGFAGDRLQSIGKAKIEYSFWSGKITSVGHDRRVKIMVSAGYDHNNTLANHEKKRRH